VNEGKRHGKGIVVSLRGCDDRDRAATLVGQDIAVVRDQLPPASHDEPYWVDLEGLSVETTEGVALGLIDHLFATGANDVVVVKGDRERLLPFIWGDVVKDVDFEQRRMLVDWDPSF
jgi:16S rRNA processing protein RimM